MSPIYCEWRPFDDDAQNASLSSLNLPTLLNRSTALRYRLRAISYQAIESAYAVQPGRPDPGRASLAAFSQLNR
jgi:hypothetical protein